LKHCVQSLQAKKKKGNTPGNIPLAFFWLHVIVIEEQWGKRNNNNNNRALITSTDRNLLTEAS
jgi:hypothetical protein